ncbi:MAG: sugar ABC transporter permease [Chloroflexota bacterium]|nr:sugar ABC transporter permease [Chloroflexota bacterium]
MLSDKTPDSPIVYLSVSSAPPTVKKSFWKRHKINSGLAFVLPAVLMYLLFVAWPIISTVQTSFFDWDGISIEREFVGFQNYIDLLTNDRTFRLSIRNNLLWAGLSITSLAVFGFLIAYMLNQRLRFRNIYRTLIFLPATASLVVIGYTWEFMYRTDGGIVNEIFKFLGMESAIRIWLADANVTIFAVIVVGIWSSLGVWVVIYLAALQGIPQDLYDSAAVDGATGFKQMVYLAIPLTMPTTRALLILGMIGSINQFGLIFLMSRGGPYHASEVMAYQIYELAFRTNHAGYASALSVLLLLLSAGVTVAQLRLIKGNFRMFG